MNAQQQAALVTLLVAVYGRECVCHIVRVTELPVHQCFRCRALAKAELAFPDVVPAVRAAIEQVENRGV